MKASALVGLLIGVSSATAVVADDRSPEVKRLVGVYAKQRADSLRQLNGQMIRKLTEIKAQQQRDGELEAMGATWALIERLRAENAKLASGDLSALLPAAGEAQLPKTAEELREWLVGKRFTRSGGDGTVYSLERGGRMLSDGEHKLERAWEVDDKDTLAIRWNPRLKVKGKLDASFRWFRMLSANRSVFVFVEGEGGEN